ncbi:HAD family hydrolase [Amnibacterium sp. CER49]|uniref:HAD family hydrolase n=1 Tax=Amnibacterium sp. CER49 TaxID=3039161 RepID=UPI002449E178|nr:HAD family hydrolase [Amnibacterium sp. CER49]MDH2443526.1 HAD family hydrolase [Amnibacterium sp. CER49]
MSELNGGPWLVALDIDGTVLHEDGIVSDRVRDAVRTTVEAGNEVMLATGRSVAGALPVLDLLGIAPEYVVCSNGAITLRRDQDDPTGYRREFVETFDPSEVLITVRDALREARYAVEDEAGHFRYTEDFPQGGMGESSEQVPFEQLLGVRATRVVVISPTHGMEEFLELVERMGLHRVSYAVGWTAWLDIAPDGVNKATALERVRERLDVPADHVVAVGDGRNDIEMLEWASREGRGVAMGQAPGEVRAVATQVAGPVALDGLAELLERLFG